MFHVTAWYERDDITEELASEIGNTSRTLHGALRLAWELIGGIPNGSAGIRRRGPAFVAFLTNNWKGELEEVEVYSPISSLVTPMNPIGPTFRGVFAE